MDHGMTAEVKRYSVNVKKDSKALNGSLAFPKIRMFTKQHA